jgi:uncharacterized low-complexity protein
MQRSSFGALVASAVVGLAGSFALASAAHADEAKACYRSHCGKSVKGHEGECGGTKVPELTDQASCEKAGGAWTTATEAKKFEKNKD